MGSKRKNRKEKRTLPEIRATLVQHSKREQSNPFIHLSLLHQLLHRYQGLSRQIKTEVTVKPTVVTNVTPAPTEASPSHTPTTSLGKSAKVGTRKRPVTLRLSTSKIARPVGTASPPIPTPQSIPTSQSKIPVPIVKADEPVSSETTMFSEMPARKQENQEHLWWQD